MHDFYIDHMQILTNVHLVYTTVVNTAIIHLVLISAVVISTLVLIGMDKLV